MVAYDNFTHSFNENDSPLPPQGIMQLLAQFSTCAAFLLLMVTQELQASELHQINLL